MASREMETLMWAHACEVLDRAERLQRQFFQPGAQRSRRPTWQPPVDVFENESEIHIVIALPGVEPERLEVTFHGDALVVAGERTLPSGAGGAAIRRLEIPQGHFERVIELPPGRYEVGRRELNNGCLYLTVQKTGVTP
jgi:HSP20 family molecular chaperone IbpA